MRFALSTNWNSDRLSDGAALADEALALGFDALELSFRTQPEHLPGICISQPNLGKVRTNLGHGRTKKPPCKVFAGGFYVV